MIEGRNVAGVTDMRKQFNGLSALPRAFWSRTLIQVIWLCFAADGAIWSRSCGGSAKNIWGKKNSFGPVPRTVRSARHLHNCQYCWRVLIGGCQSVHGSLWQLLTYQQIQWRRISISALISYRLGIFTTPKSLLSDPAELRVAAEGLVGLTKMQVLHRESQALACRALTAPVWVKVWICRST